MRGGQMRIFFWAFTLTVCAIFLPGCPSQENRRASPEWTVQIQGGIVDERTYPLLEKWQVNDREGIGRIRKLSPPDASAFSTDLEWFNGLRLWLREHSQHGPEAFKFPLYPPLMIEKMRNDKGYRATCGPFSVAYAGLLLSFDIPVRLVHVYPFSNDGNLVSHTFTEVWSESCQKWIIQDADWNIFWVDEEGSPLSAREVQKLVMPEADNPDRKIFMKRGDDQLEFTPVDSLKGTYFYRLVYAFQSNYFFIGNVPYLAHQKGSLFHACRDDEQETRDEAWMFYKHSLMIPCVQDPSVFYAPVNQIETEAVDKKTAFELRVKNNILNFSYYESRIGNGSWTPLKKERLILRKKDMESGMEVFIRGISRNGHTTKPSIVRFNVLP